MCGPCRQGRVNLFELQPLLCAGIATFNALRKCGAESGDTVEALGIGGLGHMAVQHAQRLDYRVVAIGQGSDRAADALALGAHHVIDSARDNVAERLRSLGGAQALVTALSQADAVTPLLPALAPGGRVAILAMLIAGQSGQALPAAQAHVERWPRDVLILSSLLGPFGLFAFSGMHDHDQAKVDLCERHAAAFEADDWWFLTYCGWSLAEVGDTLRGRVYTERGFELRRQNANAAHALVHVMHEAGSGDEVTALVDGWLPCYGRQGPLYGHIAWHGARVALANGDVSRALAIYCDSVAPARSVGAPISIVSDSASFLWRLRETAMRCRALLSFADGDPAGCARWLAPVPSDVIRIGGSGAQRELIADTLLAALMRSGDVARARQLLDERLHRRPSPSDSRWLVALA